MSGELSRGGGGEGGQGAPTLGVSLKKENFGLLSKICL